MSKWGLLRGMGQGIAQSGNMLMADRLDKMKEERLQKYQQQMQDKQWQRDDQVRAEDRNEREVQNAQNISLRVNERLQDQANADRQFNVTSDLVSRQIEQINQEIDLTGMELEKQRDVKNVWDQIQETEDPQQLENLFERYRRLTGTDKDDKYSLHTVPEYDDMGERIGTTVYTHNSRTNEVTPYGGEQQGRPSLEELLGTPAPGAGQQSDAPVEPARREAPEGYEVQPSVVSRAASATTGLLRQFGMSNVEGSPLSEEDQKAAVDRDVQSVKELLRNNMVPRDDRAARRALESGQLSPEEERVIREYLGA